MMNSRLHGVQAQRFAERRRREDDAPRLRDQVPTLDTLRLDIEDRSGVADGTKHTRRVVVGRAPALFLVPCSDSRCSGDEHDLTTVVMRALRAGETAFSGGDECRGSVGDSPCPHALRFTASATYLP
jgi:hypothetical protein